MIDMKKYLAIVIISLFIACNEKEEEVQEEKRAEKSTFSSSILDESNSESNNDERRVLSFQGIVDVPPNQNVSIQPLFEGYIADIKVLEGTRVKKGDLLFKIVNPDFIGMQEDYLMDKANLEFLEQVIARTRKLHSEKVTPDQDLQETEMNYKMAKSNVQAARKRLELLNLDIEQIENNKLFESINVYAPISGYIDNLLINTGEFVNQGRAVANILNTDHVHLELNVFEKDLAFLKEGQEVDFRIPEMGNENYKGEIFLIRKSIDPQTRMIGIHVHVLDEDLELIPGMFVEASVEVE